MGEWLDEVRSALRGLRRGKAWAIVTVASLAIGIGASVAAFGVIDAVRLRALPFPDADRLIVLSEVPNTREGSREDCALRCDVSYVTFAQQLETRTFRTIDAVAGFTTGGKVYMAGGEPVPVSGGVMSPNVFALMRVSPLLGRVIRPEDNQLGVPLVTVLSHDMWATLLGSDPAIVGKVIKLSDSQYTVVGVMPAGFDFEVGNDFWLPAVPTLDPSTRPSIRSLTVMARIAPGHTIAEARAELAAVELPTQPGATGQVPMVLEARPLRERYVASTQGHDVIFAAMIGALMLLACANLANLSLVRALDQRREFAMRAALGASGKRLARHLVIQQGVLIVAATLLGLLVARWLLSILSSAQALSAMRPGGMEYQLEAHTMVFAALAALVVGALLSIAPVRVALSTPAAAVMREGLGGVARSRAQQLFVVVQVAAAFALLTGGALLAKSARRLGEVSLGFDVGHVLTGSPSYPHPWRVREKYLPVTQAIVDELSRQPGVRAVAERASLPLRGPAGAPNVVVDGGGAPLPATDLPLTVTSVGPAYFDALKVPVRRGRAFTREDVEQGNPVAIVNEHAARRWWHGTDPVGHTLVVDSAPGKPVTLSIVGVVADNLAAQPRLLMAEPGPELYRPYVQAPSAFPQFVVAAAGDPAALLKPVKDILVRAVPDRPLGVQLASNAVADQLGGVRTNATQALWVALAGLLLALLGVHGVLSHAVRRRKREIGIRAAVGASGGDIAALVFRQVGWMVALGLVVGLPLARAAGRLIASLLVGTTPTDPAMLAAAAALVAFTAVLAGIAPLRRALRVDPLTALRDERA